MRRNLTVLALCSVILGWSAAFATAAPITFIGFDGGADSTDPRPNSDAAAASFDAAAALLGPISLIDFEAAPIGTYSSLDLGGGVTLTGTDFTGDTGGQSIRNAALSSPDSLFGYNTTAGGDQFAFVNGGSITFTFDDPIQAFGVYLSGIQLAGETIRYSNGSTTTIAIPDLPGGGIAFVGFTDAGASISSVIIDTTSANSPLGDFIGSDDVRYAAGAQALPEPATLSLFGLLLAGAGVRRWRGRR